MKKIFFFSLLLLPLGSSPYIENLPTNKKVIIEDGIYLGRFYRTPMFYEVSGPDIKPLGTSFPVYGIKEESESSFYLLFYKKYFQKFMHCQKIAIEKNDYNQAKINTETEFVGFHSGPLLGDKRYQDGLLLAIKDLGNSRMLISMLELSGYNFCQVEGTVIETNHPVFHRKLLFTIKNEFSDFKKERWEISLSPITYYVWRGILEVYINDEWRFQVEVIDNGN